MPPPDESASHDAILRPDHWPRSSLWAAAMIERWPLPTAKTPVARGVRWSIGEVAVAGTTRWTPRAALMPSASEASHVVGSRVRVAAAQVGRETSQVERRASRGRDDEEDAAAAPWGE